MTNPRAGRMTQRRIAELAGVSQAVVSLVLNGKADEASRIPAETSARVMKVIRDTQYTVDPAARRLAGAGNEIIGVFTYEPAFPTEAQDFYTPLLAGIEAEAEALGCDLLMFTSAPVHEGRRVLLHQNNRLRLSDGCLLLGLAMEAGELERLVDDGFPFVAVGRRDVAGVPYVGLDYVTPTAALVRRAAEAGHRRLTYLHLDSPGESVLDRQRGVREGAAEAGLEAELRAVTDADLTADLVRSLVRDGTTLVVVETAEHAEALWQVATHLGLEVPRDLSMIVLSEHARPRPESPDFTRLRPLRSLLGARSLQLLSRLLHDPELPDDERRVLIDCETVAGGTLAPPTA
jgi:LacI family transcriptional regulator